MRIKLVLSFLCFILFNLTLFAQNDLLPLDAVADNKVNVFDLPETTQGAEATLNESHRLLGETIECIARQLPNTKFDLNTYNLKLDRQIDSFLTIMDRVQGIRFIKDLTTNTIKEVNGVDFLEPYKIINSDCKKMLQEFESEESDHLSKNEKKKIASALPLYAKMFGNVHHERSIGILYHLLKGHAICENNDQFSGDLNIGLILGVRFDTPSNGTNCYDPISNSSYTRYQVFNLGALATPGIIASVGVESFTTMGYMPQKKFWPNLSLGGGIGVLVGAMNGTLKFDANGTTAMGGGASGGLISSPIGYTVFGHVGVTLNYSHKKGAIWNNQKNLRNAIEVFRTTNAPLQSKYNEKNELIFFDFPQHTLNNK